MQSRGLRVLIIFTLIASFFTISGMTFSAGSVSADDPKKPPHAEGSKPKSTPNPHNSQPANQSAPGVNALPSPGAAFGWGDNTGSLNICTGDTSYNAYYSTATPVALLDNVAQVSAGEYHTLFLIGNGTVFACGYAGDGALGNGDNNTNIDYAIPVQVLGPNCPPPSPVPSASPSASPSANPSASPAVPPTPQVCGFLTGITQIAAGYNFSMALDSDGNVYTWGDNYHGEMGTGNFGGIKFTTPQKVNGLPKIVSIAAGDDSAYAVAEDGTVYSWGYNSLGQLGQGTTTTTGCECNPTPTQVVGTGGTGTLGNIVMVTAQEYADHAIALSKDGNTVYAWGNNTYGQLGNGTYNDSNVPVQVFNVCGSFVPGPSPSPSPSASPSASPSPSPNPSPDPACGFLTGIKTIGAGGYHSLAVTNAGNVVAWGYNCDGELGAFTGGVSDCFADWPIPVNVVGPDGTGQLGGITAVAGGAYVSYAIDTLGHVYSFGYNYYGELGQGFLSQGPDCQCVYIPAFVRKAGSGGPLTGAISISGGDYTGFAAVRANPTLYTVTVSQTGTGTVAPGTSTYPGGTLAAFTATAGTGQIFVGWTLDGTYVGFASPLDITVNANHTLAATFVAAPSFTDVPTNDADYQAITLLAALGIINPNGVNGSGQFQPDNDVKRAEMAAFIARVFGWQNEFHTNTFPDRCDQDGQNCIDDELWNTVAALADYGVVGGYTDPATCASVGTTAPCYLPRDQVLRLQVVSIVARAFIKTPFQRPTGFWDRLPADLTQYTNVANSGSQRSDLTTYRTNAGPIPGQTDNTTFPNPGGNGSRRFVIQALYLAYASWYGVDRVP